MVCATRCVCVKWSVSAAFSAIVSNVTASASLHYVPTFPFRHSFHPISCCVQSKPNLFDGAMCKLMMSPCQRDTGKVSSIVNISNVASTCLWNVLKSVDGQYNESSQPDHELDTTIFVCAVAELAPRSFAEQDYEESRHQPLQPPRCNGTSSGVHSVRRSGVEQRSFAHTVSPLRAFPLLLMVVAQKDVNVADNAQYDRSHTGTDFLVLRRQRSRHGAANLFSN